jgi:pyruvate dehydrogenase E1 component
MPAGAEPDILKGLYLLREGAKAPKAPRVQLMGCGTILREVIAAAELLRNDFGVESDTWSATSFNELRRDGLSAQRWNMLHPGETPRLSHVEQRLKSHAGPVIAASDYVRGFADQIRAFVPQRYVTLGTDGYGRSDTREKLRSFFEVDRRYVAIAALKALADEGQIKADVVAQAIKRYAVDHSRIDPWKA